MTRSLVKRTGEKDPRTQMTNEDYRELSIRADEEVYLGLYLQVVKHSWIAT